MVACRRTDGLTGHAQGIFQSLLVSFKDPSGQPGQAAFGGQALVAGGCDEVPCVDVLESAEVFDRSAGAGQGAFVPVGPLASKRRQSVSALLPSGKALVAVAKMIAATVCPARGAVLSRREGWSAFSRPEVAWSSQSWPGPFPLPRSRLIPRSSCPMLALQNGEIQWTIGTVYS